MARHGSIEHEQHNYRSIPPTTNNTNQQRTRNRRPIVTQRKKIKNLGLTKTIIKTIEQKQNILQDKNNKIIMRSSSLADIKWILWRSTGVLLHLTAICIYSYLLLRNLFVTTHKSLSTFPGHSRFLTHWDIWLQLVTFILCLLCDILPKNYIRTTSLPTQLTTSSMVRLSSVTKTTNNDDNDGSINNGSINNGNSQQNFAATTNNNNNNHHHTTTTTTTTPTPTTTGGFIVIAESFLFNVRDNLIISLAIPIGSFVTLMFWFLYLVDPNSVSPPEIRKITPMYIEHLQHTVISPLIWAEVLFFHHRVISRRYNFWLLTAFALTYLIWLLFMGIHLDIWAYPLFEQLNWWQIMLFIAGAALAIYTLYRLGVYLAELAWPQRRVERFYRCPMASYVLNGLDSTDTN